MARRHRVLVVEDESLLRWSVTEMLTSEGYDCVDVGTGAAAITALREATLPFDAVLLDLRLPDSADLNLLARVRTLAPGAAVVMMTACGSRQTTDGAMALGAYSVLDKPFDLHCLDALLSNASQETASLRRNAGRSAS